jgi:TonB family protein
MGKNVPATEPAVRESGLQRILLYRPGRKQILGLLIVSVLIHVVFVVVVIPTFPVNIHPRFTRRIIEVKVWEAPLETSPQAKHGTERKVRTKKLGGIGIPAPDVGPGGSDPIDEPGPPPDPNLFVLDPDAIYRQKAPEPKEPGETSAPTSPIQEAPLFGSLDSPFFEGLPIAGTRNVSIPALIETSRAKPRYPPVARQARAQGRVVLQAVIFRDGSVGDIRVIEGSGTRFGFEEAAIAAVSQWRYVPALKDGRSVDVVLRIVVDFTLG